MYIYTFFSLGIGAAGFRCGVLFRPLTEKAPKEQVEVVDIRRVDATGLFCVELVTLLQDEEEPPAAANKWDKCGGLGGCMEIPLLLFIVVAIVPEIGDCCFKALKILF